MSQTTGSKDSPRQGPNQASNNTSQNNTKEDGAMKDDGGKKTPNIARSKRGTGFKIPLKGKVKTPSQAKPKGKTAKTPTPDELTLGTSVTLLGKIPKVKGAEFSLDDSDKFETIPVTKKAKMGESGKDVKTGFHPPDDTDIASAAWFMKMFQAAQKCMNLSNQPIAGDTSAPTRSAAQTKTRPDSPGAPTPDGPLRRDGVPAKRPRPGQRDIESRTRGRSPSTCHAPSIDINEDDSNSEYGYHRPIASRKRKWADSLLSQLSTSGSGRQSIASGRYEKEGVSVISEGFSSAIFASSPSSRHDSVESKPVSAADLITKYCPQLKAETTDSEESKPIFCLDSELGRQSVNSAAVKLDKPFSSCLNYLNDRGRDLRPTNRVVKKHFRFGERDFKHAFKTPTVPDAAFCVGDAKAKRSRYSNQNPLGSRRFKRLESQLTSIDQAARASMRLATYHTYLLTAFRESERLGISPEDRRDIWECVMKIAEYQFEQVHRKQAIQDGMPLQDPAPASPPRVGGIYRLIGRVSSRSNSKVLSASPRFRNRRGHLPVPGPPFRPSLCSSHLYKARQGNCCRAKKKRGKNFLLSGRLVDPRPLRTNPSQTLEGHNRVNDKFRPSHKLGKIKIDSNSDSGFPWSIYRHPASGGSPPSPPGSENESSRGATPVQSSLDCEDLADFSGTLSKLSEYSSPLQTEDEFSHKQFGDDCGAVSPPTLCIRDSGKVCPDKVRQPDGGNISHSRLLFEGALSPLGMDAPRGCGQGDIQSFRQPTDRSICLNTTRDPALLPRAQQTEAHTVAHYRAAAIKAGLSERAANFSAERLRSSTRSTYDSRLSHYVRWCRQPKTNPCRASVGLSRRILSLVGLWRQ
ncbi:uncharacterized protein LOC121424889 isoform X3 [Lytechinus variegatus]|uniref:uncharacterized protein LOC121424889 isoform X3 n=1 Tax=Lytechinus variegatus TaxID=7654 RepID=UPI001BB1717A|nr:uncharacterized protein LOC121424889 isoform X3 [Lytechinus variegatus]